MKISYPFHLKGKHAATLSLLICFISYSSYAQINLSGKPGLIYTPSAVESEDGQFRVGFNYNPKPYALRGRARNSERILYANITLFSRLEVNINFLQMIGNDLHKVREGIGDRQLDLRYLLVRERKNTPSVAVILTTPFTIDGAMLTHTLVTSKNFPVSENFKIETSVGYGSPYYLYRNETNLQNSSILSNFSWQKKSEDKYKNRYLLGPFGGAILHYSKVGGLMAEFDSNHINVGIYAKFFKKWTIQAAILNGDKFSFGSSYSTNLLKTDKRIKKMSDKNAK